MRHPLRLLAVLIPMIAAVAVFGGSVAWATNTPTVVYNAVPAVLPPNLPSQPFQAQQTAEFGDYVHLAGTNRALRTITVTMSDWALKSTPANVAFCLASPSNCTADGFNWPITVNIYHAVPGVPGITPNTLGSLISTTTQTFNVPWRPEANPGTGATQCGAGSTAWFDFATQACYNGKVSNITFDLGSSNVTLPDDVIVSIMFNTQTWGAHPVGTDGPYDSLNVGALGTATVGVDDNTDRVFWNTQTATDYTDHGAAGVGIFREDTNWTPNGTVNMQITAAPTVPSDTYVNPAWSSVAPGQDPDGSGPASYMGYDAFSTPQAGINAVANSDGTVNLSGGTFPAGFTVSGKSGLTIVGAGAGSTTIQPSTLISSGITHKYTGNMQVSVLVNNSTNVTISGMTITGNGSAPGAGGPDALVLWNGSTGTLQSDNITGNGGINGNQTGQGIAVDGSSGTVSLAVNDTNVSGFQKNGIDVIDGNGATTGATDTTTLNVSGGSITGAGSTGAIAQNGIVLWDRGGGSVSGSINGTTISGFHYTPLDIPGGDYATGVLTYGTNASATVTQSTLTDSDLSVVNATSAGTLSATNDWWGSASGPGTPSGVTTIPYYLDAGMTALSNNADLTGIALSTGTLNPSFSASTVDYTVSVDYGVSSISITPAANLGATTQVSGGSSLSVGDNVKTIKVTSPDGTVKNYTVTVTRRPDTTSPVIAAHDNIVVVSDTATVVNYTAPDATDNVDATAPANCSPASGSTFDIGATTVTCTKTDAAGNSATPVTFTVTVNQPPATPPTTTTTTTTPTSSTTTTGSETTTITPTSVVVSQAATDQEATTPVVQPTQSGALSAAVSQPTTADGLQPEPVSVIGSWDPGTFGTELGATVLLAPMPLPVAPVGTTPPPPAPIAGGYTLGTTAFVLAVTDSNGAAVHHFSKPLSICVSASEVGDVPASSEDGNTWKPMPLLASPPSDTPPFFPNDTFTDGYVVKADSSVCMYTLHATLFALLKDAQAPTVTKLKVKIEKNDLRLSWVGSDNVKVAGYVVSLNGHGYKATARNHDVVLALKAGTYVVRAHDPSGNVSKPSNTVVVKAVVRKDKHGKSTKHFVITKG